MKIDQVTILGAGSWGTSLAILLGKKGYPTLLWDRNMDIVEGIQFNRRNPRYLSEFEIPTQVNPTSNLQEAVTDANLIVLAVPCNAIRGIVEEIAPWLSSDVILVSAAKGLESTTGLRVSQVIQQVLKEKPARVVALSGPNLAVELAKDIPTTTVVASEDEELARQVQSVFMAPIFRVYTNSDIIGVELGGALKNIIAIGAGASDGLGYGDNTKASLMTRGLAEIIRLGVAMGSREETFRGLSGIGDLITTCASQLSRNHRVGYELARGKKLEDILQEMGQVAEGVPTTRAACKLAAEHHVEMPIASEVYHILFDGKPAKEAVYDLMTRESKSEMAETKK